MRRLLLWLAHRDWRARSCRSRDGFLLVVLAWTGAAGLRRDAAADLLLPELSFTDAYFEAVSGLTTTGATVLSEPRPAAATRSTCGAPDWCWLGGMGLIVLAVAILPLLGVGGRQMFKAETPGPDEGHQADAAHRRNGQGAVGGLLRHHRRLHRWRCRWAGMTLVRRRHAMPSRPWAWAASRPTTPASASSIRRRSRSVTDRLHADRRHELRDATSSPSAAAACGPTCAIPEARLVSGRHAAAACVGIAGYLW
ncbi:MAG: hypothetical protein MZW92_76220 [Comamonadaceae bacterium]|nr:hypothetical protein [Comamonadaceae bacterium]